MQECAQSNHAEDELPKVNEDVFRIVTHDCTTADEFLEKITLYNKRYYKEGRWIFRGQNNAEWSLIPSLFRNDLLFKMASNLLEKYAVKHDVRSSPDHVLRVDDGYRFVLARVCAALEQNRVFAFMLGIDNADIEVPQHSEFNRVNFVGNFPELYQNPIFGARIAPSSDFRHDSLEREIDMLIRSYREVTRQIPQAGSALPLGLYPFLEQRYLDVSFALAQHSGVDTGLLDWTENPLVAAFYAAHIRDSSCPQFEKIAVWAADSARFKSNPVALKLIRTPRAYVRNMHAQSALFTRDAYDWSHYVSARKIPRCDVLLSTLVDHDSEQHGVWRITLPFDKRHDLLDLLRRSNISLSTLEPTLYHVADEVMQDFDEGHLAAESLI